MKKFALSLLIVSAAALARAQDPSYSNVPYVNDGHARHTLDVYIPPGISEPAKTVIYIHGGWWLAGSKEKAMSYTGTLYEAGYVVVGINYRLSHDSIFPAQIYDCKTAIRYLKKNADKYYIDTCNIAVTGESAGGHLSALLGTSIGEPSLEGLHLGSSGYSSDIHAVIDFFGPTAFLEMDGNAPNVCSNPIIHDNAFSGESLLLGCRISQCPERAAKANPITYINGNEPPFSIHHGDADCLIPPNQSILLHKALEQAGIDTEIIIYPGGGHGDFINTGVKKAMLGFLDNKMQNDCNTLSVNGLNAPDRLFSVYPNPAKDRIFIKGIEGPVMVEVFSLAGTLIKQEKPDNGIVKLSSLSPGVYILNIPEHDYRSLFIKN